MSVLVGTDGAVLDVVAGPVPPAGWLHVAAGSVPAGVLVPLPGRDGIQGIQGLQGVSIEGITVEGDRLLMAMSDGRVESVSVSALAESAAAAASTSAATALDAAAVATAAAVSVVTYTGTGSPQGVVAAPVGAIYTDTAATNGAVRWIKTSGTGTTGWTVSYGDTGTRSILGSLADGTASAIHLRRIGQSVELAIADWRPAAAGTVTFLPPGTIPAGMRPPAGRSIAPVIGPNAAGRISLATNGQATIYGAIAGTVTNALGTWTTNDQWPTALPGTPA